MDNGCLIGPFVCLARSGFLSSLLPYDCFSKLIKVCP